MKSRSHTRPSVVARDLMCMRRHLRCLLALALVLVCLVYISVVVLICCQYGGLDNLRL